MRITIVAIGGRGDVWPYVALGMGLQRAGHAVKLATHEEFEADIRDVGLGYFRVGGSPREMLATEAGQRWLESGGNTVAFIRWTVKATSPLIEAGVNDMMKACLGAELIIFTPMAFPAGHFAERLGVPCIAGDGVPHYRTSAFPNPMVLGGRSLGGPLNLLTHLGIEQLAWQPMRTELNRWRNETLELPPLPFLGPAFRRDRVVPMILHYSAHVSPRPADWPSWRHVTGFWYLDPAPGWQPPADLVDFLEAGSPPVWVGFGSMVARDAERLTDLVLEALRLVGRRGILQSGWSGLGERAAGSDVLVVRSAEHHWLFPRVAAVVHHGGGGTTGAGLRAGAPSVLTPFFADQFYWARRTHALGAGPAPIPHRRLTVERLATALRAATEDQTIRARAAEVGAKLRAEDGVANCVTIIERYAESWVSGLAAVPV